MKTVIALALLFCAIAEANPFVEISYDGVWWRIHNPDPVAHYCWVGLGTGEQFEKIVYPGSYTRWYPTWGGYIWECRQ